MSKNIANLLGIFRGGEYLCAQNHKILLLSAKS